jgi:hypothetical protein
MISIIPNRRRFIGYALAIPAISILPSLPAQAATLQTAVSNLWNKKDFLAELSKSIVSVRQAVGSIEQIGKKRGVDQVLAILQGIQDTSQALNQLNSLFAQHENSNEVAVAGLQNSNSFVVSGQLLCATFGPFRKNNTAMYQNDEWTNHLFDQSLETVRLAGQSENYIGYMPNKPFPSNAEGVAVVQSAVNTMGVRFQT